MCICARAVRWFKDGTLSICTSVCAFANASLHIYSDSKSLHFLRISTTFNIRVCLLTILRRYSVQHLVAIEQTFGIGRRYIQGYQNKQNRCTHHCPLLKYPRACHGWQNGSLQHVATPRLQDPSRPPEPGWDGMGWGRGWATYKSKGRNSNRKVSRSVDKCQLHQCSIWHWHWHRSIIRSQQQHKCQLHQCSIWHWHWRRSIIL